MLLQVCAILYLVCSLLVVGLGVKARKNEINKIAMVDYPPQQLIPNETKLRNVNENCDCLINFDSRAYSEESFFHLHIPKTGGSTFADCLLCWDEAATYFAPKETGEYLCKYVNTTLVKSQLQSGERKVVSCEIQVPGHLPIFLGKLYIPNLRIVTFIRQPLAHIFSAIMHFLNQPGRNPCKTFQDIVRADEDHHAPQCYRYNLHNMQTSALSIGHTPNISQAITFLTKNAFHFGITNFYRTSYCLLAFQLGQLLLHANVCDCSRHSIKQLRHSNDHNTKKGHEIIANAKILSDDDLITLESKYINLDRMLYQASLHLFLERVIIAEKAVGFPLLCADTDGEGVMAMKSTIRKPLWYGVSDQSH